MSQNTSHPITDRTPYAYLDDDGEVFIPGTYRRPVDDRSLWLVSEADIRREIAAELERIVRDEGNNSRYELIAAATLLDRAEEIRNG